MCKVLPCDLALLAMGFLGPDATLAEALGVELDLHSNFQADFGRFATCIEVRCLKTRNWGLGYGALMHTDSGAHWMHVTT